MRIGVGYDVHAFGEGRKLILGGAEIPFDRGLIGHSDADVLVHAVNDAILGALALGDIGKHFPDTDPAYKDICSLRLMEQVRDLMWQEGYDIGNVDAVITCQQPKLAPYIDEMRGNIAAALDTEFSRVSVKATTTERLGFEGREEGISCYAVVLLEKNEE